mmetsp:Transcript_18593/g.39062  ORF Transcript_18593/g.39062 Transcript_18593/m.39062 type:complete len:251 (-) Transcript_18593:79-831(-)
MLTAGLLASHSSPSILLVVPGDVRTQIGRTEIPVSPAVTPPSIGQTLRWTQSFSEKSTSSALQTRQNLASLPRISLALCAGPSQPCRLRIRETTMLTSLQIQTVPSSSRALETRSLELSGPLQKQHPPAVASFSSPSPQPLPSRWQSLVSPSPTMRPPMALVSTPLNYAATISFLARAERFFPATAGSPKLDELPCQLPTGNIETQSRLLPPLLPETPPRASRDPCGDHSAHYLVAHDPLYPLQNAHFPS